jgi:protocatechuate 3,4-dioxygenase beta subunit
MVRLVLIAGVWSALMATPARGPQASGQGQVQSLSGVVTADSPLAGVQVTLSEAGGSRSRHATTSADGRYRFDDVPIGRYLLFADKPGYVRTTFGSAPGRAMPVIVVVPHQGGRDLDMTLARGGVISGTVTLDGRPLGGVPVSAVQRHRARSDRETEPLAVSSDDPSAARSLARTNTRGEFRLFGLPPGTYGVRAVVRRVAGNSEPPVIWYWGDTTDSAAALEMRLAAGNERRVVIRVNGDIQAQAVRGTVVGPGAPGAHVRLFALAGDRQAVWDRAVADQAGRFAFRGALPGEYRIEARASSAVPRSGHSAWGEAPLSVPAGGSAAEARIVLTQPTSVSGRISGPPDRAVRALTFTPVALWRTEPAIEAPVGERGEFTVHGLAPGRYQLNVATHGNNPLWRWGVQSIDQDGADYPGPIITIERTSRIVISVSLARLDQGVRGTVRDREGRPTTDMVMLLFAADRRYWSAESDRIRVTRPATDGSFAFAELIPGHYRVVALGSLELDAIVDPTFLESLSSAGLPVEVTPGVDAMMELVSG